MKSQETSRPSEVSPMFTRRFLVSLLVGMKSSVFAASKEDPYNQVGILSGQVFVANDPTLGRTQAAGLYFVLQRVDCRQCIVGVRTDIDGRYTVYLGVGKYRVICDEPSPGGGDLIKKGQAREVTVRPAPDDAVFNFDLEIQPVR